LNQSLRAERLSRENGSSAPDAIVGMLAGERFAFREAPIAERSDV
jgi:hypothetical protein